MYKSLEPYAKLVNFLSAALGDNCEIALHDLTSKDQEIVAISNNPISGREVGAKLSNLSLHYLEEKQYLNHDFVMNYKTVGNDGKLMRAATYFIKEEGREMPVGMLCINVNISDLEYLTSTIKKILGIKEEKDIEFKMDNPVEILSSPLDEMIDIAKSLSKNIPCLRVDLYLCNDKIYIGELTFSHFAGFTKFEPKEYETILGNYIKIGGKRNEKK